MAPLFIMMYMGVALLTMCLVTTFGDVDEEDIGELFVLFFVSIGWPVVYTLLAIAIFTKGVVIVSRAAIRCIMNLRKKKS